MSTTTAPPPDVIDTRYRFLERHKVLSVKADVMEQARTIQRLLAARNTADLRALLDGAYPADLADAMYFLNDPEDQAVFDLLSDEEAAEVLDELDEPTERRLVMSAPPERLARIIGALPADDAAFVVDAMTPDKAATVLGMAAPEKAAAVRTLLAYPRETAGRIMSLGYVALGPDTTQAEAVRRFATQRDTEHVFYLYVVDGQGALVGAVDLHTLLRAPADARLGDLMVRNVVSVQPETDQEQVAHIFARYDLEALAVAERETRRLLGIITADDIIDVIEQEGTEDAMHMAGSDAAELERRSPARIALLRLPWIMATMFIELLAGFVIHYFDSTLAHVLLLASFMPIISAISGNTGLQSATIIVRGLSTGQVQIARWQTAVVRQFKTTLILGAATGLVLGVIGAVWYGKAAFGFIIFTGMFAAVNIAGIVGTVVPLISKSLGFDPALTSGPFETAFQDVVGISIFLGLATALINYLL